MNSSKIQLYSSTEVQTCPAWNYKRFEKAPDPPVNLSVLTASNEIHVNVTISRKLQGLANRATYSQLARVDKDASIFSIGGYWA